MRESTPRLELELLSPTDRSDSVTPVGQRDEPAASGIILPPLRKTAPSKTDVRLTSIMGGPPAQVSRNTTVGEACRVMRQLGVEEVLVVRDSRAEGHMDNVLGILTESDAVKLLAYCDSPSDVVLEQAMSSPVETVKQSTSIENAEQLLEELGVRRRPVVDGEKIVGLLTRDVLLRGMNQELSGMRRTTRRLEQEAHHDALTGLANRRLFDLVLERELAQHKRNGRGLGLVMLDIDLFKQINDTYSHACGDRVLAELAERLRQVVRASDLVARVGGEEFAIIASIPNAGALMILAEKVRKCVEERPFETPSEEEYRNSTVPPSPRGSNERAVPSVPPPKFATQAIDVTVSVGAAAVGGRVDCARRLIRTADDALYKAKNGGRNCSRLGSYQASATKMRAVQPDEC